MRIQPGILAILAIASATGQSRFFAGAVGGVATLSADARFEVPQQAAASGYKPENGPTFSPFFGVHVSDYFSIQASYLWNHNDMRYHALEGAAFYDQRARTAQHLVLGDAMLYFRSRTSWVRPYLAAGTGIAYVSSQADAATGALGGAPGNFHEHSPVLNVAVGIDVQLRRGWAFRYSFGETIQRNAFSSRLMPPGQRNLASFRNFFGIAKYF